MGISCLILGKIKKDVQFLVRLSKWCIYLLLSFAGWLGGGQDQGGKHS